MTAYKPRIFIGSSSEARPIAELVFNELSGFAECKIWYKQFDLGNSAYEDLVNKLSLYDYGILIGTADDNTTSRGTRRVSPRDNIVFEFGLFSGRLGRQRTFLMAESGLKLPSDVNGITLPFFPSAKTKPSSGSTTRQAVLKQKKAIAKCCKEIRSHIKKRDNIFDFGFLPSTSLAYGYFNNFVLKAVTNLLESKTLRLGNTCGFPQACQKEQSLKDGFKHAVDGMSFTELKLTILIPDTLTADMFDQVKAHRRKHNWQLIKIDAGAFRPFDFYIQAEKSAKGTLHLSDIPLTLNALNESIRAYVGKSYIGFSDAERLLEQREIRTFKNVLDYLISANPLTKDRVNAELVST
jgi:Prokaryotic STING domain/CAP12/Pycsar effector protein, TIR domain